MSDTENFIIGDIVALKSHPLFRSTSKIIEFPAQVPPLLIVKEVIFEDIKKKKLYSEELGMEFKISDLIKYNCVYFSANKSEFIEVTLYHSLIASYKELKYFNENINNQNTKKFQDIYLIPEVHKYEQISKYDFGKVIQFKTKKLEQRKSYDSNSEKNQITSFQTPDFILTGVKSENNLEAFYPDGSPKKIISNLMYKVMWFNHYQQKFSEQYLPKECFVKDIPFETSKIDKNSEEPKEKISVKKKTKKK